MDVECSGMPWNSGTEGSMGPYTAAWRLWLPVDGSGYLEQRGWCEAPGKDSEPRVKFCVWPISRGSLHRGPSLEPLPK